MQRHHLPILKEELPKRHSTSSIIIGRYHCLRRGRVQHRGRKSKSRKGLEVDVRTLIDIIFECCRRTNHESARIDTNCCQPALVEILKIRGEQTTSLHESTKITVSLH